MARASRVRAVYIQEMGGKKAGASPTLPVLMKAPGQPDVSNSAISRGIYIKNNHGVVHVEGLLVDATGVMIDHNRCSSFPASLLKVDPPEGIKGIHFQYQP